jgi:hypothetical protein
MKKAGVMNQTLADFAFERPLKARNDVSLSAFSFLFSEIVQQIMKSDKEGGLGGGDLDSSLHTLGLPIGEKILELLFYREKGGVNGACSSTAKRETKIVQMLHFINKDVFKSLFGK